MPVISRLIGISSLPFLMAAALLSSTGGGATPNVLIGSAAGWSAFVDYVFHILNTPSSWDTISRTVNVTLPQ